MSTVSNAVWELQMSVVAAAAELVSALPLDRMSEVTEVSSVAPPSLQNNSVTSRVVHAPLNEQQALVDAAIHFRNTLEDFLESTSTH